MRTQVRFSQVGCLFAIVKLRSSEASMELIPSIDHARDDRGGLKT